MIKPAVAQPAEATDLKSVKYEFESHAPDQPKIAPALLTFKGICIHICTKTMLDRHYVLDGAFAFCPFCGVKI